MLLLVDANGNPLGSTQAVDPASSGLAVFCVSDVDRSPVPVMWTLQNSGLTFANIPGFGTKLSAPRAATFFYGIIEGYTGSVQVQSMTTAAPATSTVYFPPPVGLYLGVKINALLIASNGAESVALQISVTPPACAEWA